MGALAEAAAEYALKGWKVFPLWPLSKRPHSELVPQGMNEASSFPGDILYWWERCPDANIGLNCRESGLIVLDIDPRNGGYDSMTECERRLGGVSPAMEQVTPTGGLHILFEHPGEQYAFKKELAPGIDIKDRGYIVLAPSVREMGAYRWETEDCLGPLPSRWREAMEASQRPVERSLSPSEAPLLQIPAEEYVRVLTGREDVGGWFQCPFHKEGQERTPSLKANGSMWACFGCEPMMGKQVMGGNIVDFAGLLWGYAMPVRGIDLAEVMDRLHCYFEPA